MLNEEQDRQLHRDYQESLFRSEITEAFNKGLIRIEDGTLVDYSSGDAVLMQDLYPGWFIGSRPELTDDQVSAIAHAVYEFSKSKPSNSVVENMIRAGWDSALNLYGPDEWMGAP